MDPRALALIAAVAGGPGAAACRPGDPPPERAAGPPDPATTTHAPATTPHAPPTATGASATVPRAPATGPHAPATAPPATPPSSPAPAPTTLEAALADLRDAGLTAAADHIARRVAQRRPKMRLTADEGRAAAIALRDLARDPPFRELHAVMPRSAVELARAVAERGVPLADATAIARYLARVVGLAGFAGLERFDEHHSHVVGRRWHEIDYTGEGMTWQGQKARWQPRGVLDFRDARSIDAYFVAAERMEHWRRIYRPRARLAATPRDVRLPPP